MKAIVFDLDGTLLNTLEDIANSMNRVLIKNQFSPYSTEDYKYMVGSGMQALVKKAVTPFTKKPEKINQLFEEMKDDYLFHWNIATKPYEGIMETLFSLAEAGIVLSILSNKPDSLTKKTVQHFFPTIPFFMIQGASSYYPEKPNPACLINIMKETNLPKEEFIMIGDSSIDIETAINASVFPAGVLWGFRKKEELEKKGAKIFFEHPSDILKFFKSIELKRE